MATARSSSSPAGAAGPSVLGLSHMRKPPKFSFRGRMAEATGLITPGPGAYAPQPVDVTTSRYQKGPKYAFGVSGRDNLDKQRVPGPGAYGHKRGIGENSSSWSLTPRRSDKVRDVLPGPGAHEIKSSLGRGPQYSASPRPADTQRGLHPGPGEYDHFDQATKEKQPNWGFGTSMRPDATGNGSNATPGPGAYTDQSGIQDGPKFSMQARRQGPRAHPSPGPGAHGGHWGTFT